MRKTAKRRALYCAAALVLALLLCGDMAFLRRQPCLPELCAVERQLRALTADAPDGWRYSLRVLAGPGGAELAADAVRRNAFGTWEAIHTLWRPENGTWRMVYTAHQSRRLPPGAEGEHGRTE